MWGIHWEICSGWILIGCVGKGVWYSWFKFLNYLENSDLAHEHFAKKSGVGFKNPECLHCDYLGFCVAVVFFSNITDFNFILVW